MNSPQREQIDFPQQLKLERTRRGWSQAKVAEQLGTETKTISRWERGVALPAAYLRGKLCDLFARTLEEWGLLEGLDEELPPLPLPTPLLFDPSIPLLPAIPLVGRDEQFAHLKHRLCGGGNVALSALNGLPGVGKTALSIALAHDRELHASFQDGVLWVGLGPTPHIQSHLSRWGTLLGLSSSEMSMLKSTEDWSLALRKTIGTRRMLLVIDDAWRPEDALAFKIGGPGCAHLLTTRFPPIAAQVALEGATVLKELSNEQGLTLLSMLAPQAVEQEPQRARELVRAVGGLPLALNLIGNYLRIQAYTGSSRRVATALQRLNDIGERLDLAEPRGPVERHSSQPGESSVSLRTIIATTEQYLSEQGRDALYALSVFPAKPNTFSEEAALAVADCSAETLDLLSDMGLLQSGGTERYTLHQTIADYARLQLKGDDASKRFIASIVAFVQAHSLDYGILEIESGNILAALDTAFDLALSDDFIRLVCDFAPFLIARGLYSTGEMHLQRAYTAALAKANQREQIPILLRLGQFTQRMGHFVQAERYFQEGLALARQNKHHDITIFLSDLGSLCWKRGNYAQANAYLQEGLLLAREDNRHTYLYSILLTLCSVAQRQGKFRNAEGYVREALDLYRMKQEQEQDQAELSLLLASLATSLAYQEQYEGAEQVFLEGLEIARRVGHHEWVANILNNLGDMKKNQGDYVQAEVYLQEGLELARQIRHREWMCVLAATCGEVARRQGRYEQARGYLQEGMDLAKEVGIPQMVALALAEFGQIALLTGNLASAEHFYQEMRGFVPNDDQELIALMEYGFAQLAAMQGNVREARRLGVKALAHIPVGTVQQVNQWLASLSAE